MVFICWSIKISLEPNIRVTSNQSVNSILIVCSIIKRQERSICFGLNVWESSKTPFFQIVNSRIWPTFANIVDWVDMSIILQISDHSTTHPTAKVVELKLLLQLQFLTLTATSPLFSNLTWAWPILVPACSYCFLFGLVFWHMHKKNWEQAF